MVVLIDDIKWRKARKKWNRSGASSDRHGRRRDDYYPESLIDGRSIPEKEDLQKWDHLDVLEFHASIEDRNVMLL